MAGIIRVLLLKMHIAIDAAGNYVWVWYADMAMAAFAVALNLPIRRTFNY